MRRVLVALAVLLAVFLIGYVPGMLNARKARSENSRLELELGLARLQGKLGMVAYQVNRNNFADASALSTGFFDGLKNVLGSPLLDAEAKRKAALEAVAARRDEINADLARADPAVKEKVADTFVQLTQAIETP